MPLGTVSAWIDGDGYIRKFEESFSVQTPNAGQMDMKLAATFSDFGKSVSVSVPAASATADGTGQAIPGLGG